MLPNEVNSMSWTREYEERNSCHMAKHPISIENETHFTFQQCTDYLFDKKLLFYQHQFTNGVYTRHINIYILEVLFFSGPSTDGVNVNDLDDYVTMLDAFPHAALMVHRVSALIYYTSMHESHGPSAGNWPLDSGYSLSFLFHWKAV